MRTAGTAFLEALKEAGVSYIFANLGSDHPAIVESIEEGKANGRAFPAMLTCPNEMVALSAAHGYAQVSGEAQAVIVHVETNRAFEMALVENLQRADLNPIEEAEGYEQLIRDFSLTQQEVADIVGKDRSTVANTLRLLALPATVRRLVWDGQLTVGHARALLGIGDELRIADLAREVVAHGLSVRDVERRVREDARSGPKKGATSGTPAPGAADARSAEVRHLEDQLRKHLGTDAKIVQSGKERGELRIPFYSGDDFERLLDLLLGANRL